MLDLEQRILAWRAKTLTAFSMDQLIVDELEDHLRESIASRVHKGVPIADAFLEASGRIGDLQVIAFQYSHIKPKKRSTMKILRVVATILVSSYLLVMSLQLIGICAQLVQKRMSPYSADAPAAFFSNLIVCVLCSLALWLLWRKRPILGDSANHIDASTS